MTEETRQFIYEDNLMAARRFTDTRRYAADSWNASHTEPIDEDQVALFLTDEHYGKGMTSAQPEKPKMTDFKPYMGRKRKPGTGCVTEINDHLFEGRYSPKWPDGKKHSRNVYAHTREECEEKLKVLIVEMKAEIAEAKRLKESGRGDGRPLERRKGKRAKKNK